MSGQKYSGYTAQIYQADDASSAAAKGDAMKSAFPGADYEVVPGDPCGLCSHVDGREPNIRKQIQDWINGR